MTYRYLAHTADVKVVIDASTLEGVFTDATKLMKELLVGPSSCAARHSRTIELRAPSADELLLSYLRELLYAFATDRFVPDAARFSQLDSISLVAEVAGEPFDPTTHEQQPEVKAVTRHQLCLVQRGGRWHAEVIFDV